jgi:hypothetical protein
MNELIIAKEDAHMGDFTATGHKEYKITGPGFNSLYVPA